MTESEEELKRLLTMVTEESEKAALKLNIQKTKTMASLHGKEMGWGESKNSDRLFSWVPESLQIVTAVKKLKDACPFEEKQ